MNTEEISYRQADIEDLDDIANLYREDEAVPDVGLIALAVSRYPSALALSDAELIGFAYSRPFAPDILELLNIFVRSNRRNRHIGERLLSMVEAQALALSYCGIIAVNSNLYRPRPGKQPATNFYIRQGYEVSFATRDSRLFTKTLYKTV